MRKNSARRWLHFILDLLPLIVIPIFAINIINRSPEPISVEVGDTEQVVDIQYKYQSNEVNSVSDLIVDNIYYFLDTFDSDNSYIFNYDWKLTLISGYLETDDFNFSIGTNIYPNTSIYIRYDTLLSKYYISLYGMEVSSSYIYFDDAVIQFNTNNFSNWLDDTELTYEAFEKSTYNVIESVDVYEQGTTVVYDDTDIGSQFLYTVYHAVDEYFNFDNVFNFGELKVWLGTNLFGGTMPMVGVIVYNIMIYELLMDLMFLLYAVFMWFIDMCTSLIERCYVKSKGD